MDARPRDADETPEEPTGTTPERVHEVAEPTPDTGAGAHGDAGTTDDAAETGSADATPRASGTDESAASTEATGAAEDEIDDVDRRWQEIVAQLGEIDHAAGDSRTARDGGDVEPPGRRADDVAPADPPRGPRPPPVPRVVRAAETADPRGWEPDPEVEEAENHFEPPDPGPVLSGEPLLTMAWVAVVGVPVLMLLAVVVWRDLPALVLQVAGVAFALGLGLLVWRMPHGGDDDDRGPGAVV